MKMANGSLMGALLMVCAVAMAAPAQADSNSAFLEKNMKRRGVEVTDSGLQYRVVRKGSGKKPSASDKVRVHYRGKLVDGTVFDSSYRNGQPAEFPLDGVIPGWTEGLQLMREGAKYEFVIPARLAYGSKGAGDVIPPNATLIFEVELLKVM